MSIKYLDIAHFERQGTKVTAPIWGLNTADRSVLQATGEVILQIPKRNGTGQPDMLQVPQTWLPQELTREIPRQRLLNSSEFRKAVSQQLISLIDEETAQRMLRQGGAAEERERLSSVAAHVRKAGSARSISDSNAVISRADGSEDEDDESGINKTVIIDHNDDRHEKASKKSVAQLASNGLEDIEPGISASFKMWADKMNRGRDIEAKNLIKGRRQFSLAELSFLSRNLNRAFTETLAMVNKNLVKAKK